MTHPPAGPSTPPPPSGPRYTTAAELAGARGHSPEPMHPRRRLRSYWIQGGVEGKQLTPKQRRRAEHKANLAAKRAELAA